MHPQYRKHLNLVIVEMKFQEDEGQQWNPFLVFFFIFYFCYLLFFASLIYVGMRKVRRPHFTVRDVKVEPAAIEDLLPVRHCARGSSYKTVEKLIKLYKAVSIPTHIEGN